MPSKIIRSNVPISEPKVKKLYLDSIKYRVSAVDRDPETKFPLLKPVDEADIQKDYAWMLRESLRKHHRAVVDVKDGKVIPNDKPVKAVKKSVNKVS